MKSLGDFPKLCFSLNCRVRNHLLAQPSKACSAPQCYVEGFHLEILQILREEILCSHSCCMHKAN